MANNLRLVCGVAGHERIIQRIELPSGDYHASNLLSDMQKFHDTKCSCATRVETAWKVEMRFADDIARKLLDFSVWADSERDPRVERIAIGAEDMISDYFPSQPNEVGILHIVCVPSGPSSPTSGGSERRLENDEDPKFELPCRNSGFMDFHAHPRMVFVDKTPFLLRLPQSYRYLLIRPPNFGKTALLSALTEFYDIRSRDSFGQFFGSLHGSTPHNQHLCLTFNFAYVRKRPCIEELTSALENYIWACLNRFLARYSEELDVDNQEFLDENPDDPLTAVLALVKKRGFTLFVTVDDHDGPASSRILVDHSQYSSYQRFASQEAVMSLMDSCFWGPIRAASGDVIRKLFVTATFPVPSPTLQAFLDDISGLADFHAICGFTQQETLKLASVIEADVSVADLRRSCGEYLFSSALGSVEPVFHPQRTISRLREAAHLPSMQIDNLDRAFEYLRPLLKGLAEESEGSGLVSVQGLIDLLASGAVEITEKMDDPLVVERHGPCITWSALYYLGVLTRDSQLENTFRISTDLVRSIVRRFLRSVVRFLT
ncbi:hypothetical protein DFH06DRAFT_530917 [Mycena polygramma]|nr:hypothetical protein DFH06DRAFT_530917 [Mycena polygramma]